MLQWGRDHLIAEILIDYGDTSLLLTLQWGRDHLIAEMISSSVIFASSEERLQWGRDHLIAEMAARQRDRLSAFLASMGPRSSDRGNEQKASE